jgi:hypothetical protein
LGWGCLDRYQTDLGKNRIWGEFARKEGALKVR